MKQLSLASVLFCLFLVSCSSDNYSGVDQTQEYKALEEGMTELLSWSSTRVPNEEDLLLETLEVQTTGGCPVTTAAITDRPDIDPPLYREFVAQLGFKSVRELHDWFVDYGRAIYDLKIEYRANDEEAFIDELSLKLVESLEISSCRTDFIQKVNIQAFRKASYYGVNFGNSETVVCNGALLYGSNSSFTQLLNFIRDNANCNI